MDGLRGQQRLRRRCLICEHLVLSSREEYPLHWLVRFRWSHLHLNLTGTVLHETALHLDTSGRFGVPRPPADGYIFGGFHKPLRFSNLLEPCREHNYSSILANRYKSETVKGRITYSEVWDNRASSSYTRGVRTCRTCHISGHHCVTILSIGN